MSNATPSYLGAINGLTTTEADKVALFQKLFTGEVLTAFNEANKMEAHHRVRNISNSRSASFANTGKAVGRYHTPGTEILGQNMLHNETVITVDAKLISDVFIADIYEAMNHYEVRGEYSTQLGQALARIYDKSVFRVALTAARSPNKITGLPGGTEIALSAGYAAATDAAKAIEMADALFAAAEQFDTDETPTEGRVCFIRPETYYQLVRNKDLLNQDWGGLGSYSNAELPQVAGIPLIMTNHLPNQLDVPASGVAPDGIDIVSDKYTGDFSKTKALIMTPHACGTVKLMDLRMESEYDIRRQGTLMVASMAIGHGVLRPECAIEIVIP
jgi:hypothetical protein